MPTVDYARPAAPATRRFKMSRCMWSVSFNLAIWLAFIPSTLGVSRESAASSVMMIFILGLAMLALSFGILAFSEGFGVGLYSTLFTFVNVPTFLVFWVLSDLPVC